MIKQWDLKRNKLLFTGVISYAPFTPKPLISNCMLPTQSEDR